MLLVNTVNIFGGKGSPGTCIVTFYRELINPDSSYSPFFSDLNNGSVWQNVGKTAIKPLIP